MKYIGQAMARFESLEKQVSEQGKFMLDMAKHMKDSDKKLEPLFNAIEQAQKAREQTPTAVGTAGTPMQSGGGMGMLMQLLPALMGGGGGSNPMMEKMMQSMMERNLMGMDLSNALTKAMIIKLAPELAESLTKGIVKK